MPHLLPSPARPIHPSSSAASFLRSQINCFLPPAPACACCLPLPVCLCFPGIELQRRTKPRQLGCRKGGANFCPLGRFWRKSVIISVALQRPTYLPQLRPVLYVHASARAPSPNDRANHTLNSAISSGGSGGDHQHSHSTAAAKEQ